MLRFAWPCGRITSPRCQTQCGNSSWPRMRTTSGISDALTRHQLLAEATAHWQFGRTHDRQSSKSAECAARLFSQLKLPDERIAFANEMLQTNTPYNTRFAQWAAIAYLEKGDI